MIIFNITNIDTRIRQLAGLEVKNYLERLKDAKYISYSFLNILKGRCLDSLYDENNFIQNTLNSIISTFVKIGGLTKYGELSNNILQELYSNNNKLLLRVLNIFQCIVEDLDIALINNIIKGVTLFIFNFIAIGQIN
jgi:hypothetical protein